MKRGRIDGVEALIMATFPPAPADTVDEQEREAALRGVLARLRELEAEDRQRHGYMRAQAFKFSRFGLNWIFAKHAAARRLDRPNNDPAVLEAALADLDQQVPGVLHGLYEMRERMPLSEAVCPLPPFPEDYPPPPPCGCRWCAPDRGEAVARPNPRGGME